MKKIILLLALFFSISAIAQINVFLKIDHFLGTNSFSFNTATTNNIGDSFNVTRLQYYISQIVLVHDGGQEIAVGKWILADAGTPLNEQLGSYNITTLEAVKFAVGVEAAVNHNDPSTYAASHPLSPKSPSMHWGWASGYRFVAMEGTSGASLNQTYEIHALGDANYFMVTLPTAGVLSNNDLTIAIDADYEQALKNISVNSGLILHSETGQAVDFLRNFAYFVFKSSDGNATIGTDEWNNASNEITMFPNPSSGTVTILANASSGENLSYIVSNPLGQIVKKATLTGNEKSVHFSDAGLYFVTILENGNFVQSERIIIAR